MSHGAVGSPLLATVTWSINAALLRHALFVQVSKVHVGDCACFVYIDSAHVQVDHWCPAYHTRWACL